jgi:sugar phosphate isomerase/epimerase
MIILPGKGKLPLSDFLKLLKKEHYKGIISLELRPDVLGEGDEKEIIRRLKKAREFVIKYLGA